MYDLHEKKLKEELQQEFGTLTARQLWTLTKLAKRVRLRGRNNSAFNSMMNRLFPYASFRQITKVREDQSSYPGLQITVTDEHGEVSSNVEGDENE